MSITPLAEVGITVSQEPLPESQLKLSIEVPAQRVDQTYERVLQRLSQRVKIGGFRPGKAPRPLLEARIGEPALREEVIDALIPPVVSEAIREQGIESVDRPEVEVTELERGKPASLVATVTVWPEVSLAHLDSLRVERLVSTVDDALVEERIAELRAEQAEIEPVDREIQTGDIVIGDLSVTVDGEELPEEARPALELEVSEGVLVPELLAALPGRREGDLVEVPVQMPEDHGNEKLKSKAATLLVKVTGVKEKRVPELSDELAQRLSNSAQETAQEFRSALRQQMVERAARLDELNFERSVLKAVVDSSEVTVPKALVERELDRQIDELEHKLQHRGLRLDRYLEYRKQSLAEFRAEEAPAASDRLKVDMVLEAAGKELAIQPSEDEVTEYLRTESAKDPETKDGDVGKLEKNEVARDYFRHRLTRLKILEALVARVGAEPVADDGSQVAAKEEVQIAK
ncbi:MAG: trigger factor [Candidatus Dormibacteraeota bacterium]|nr:trigger factor [Candidatus Dormibacteraeota bacterium]